jgi:hypothetical protein
VRVIRTPQHGAWLAIVNTGYGGKSGAKIRLPEKSAALDAVSDVPLTVKDGTIELTLRPFELRAIRLLSEK